MICKLDKCSNKKMMHILHCFRIKVRLGKHTKSKDCGEQATKECSQPPQQDFTVEHVSIHYDYNRTTLANDIALLRLTSTVNTHGIVLNGKILTF